MNLIISAVLVAFVVIGCIIGCIYQNATYTDEYYERWSKAQTIKAFESEGNNYE